MNLGRRGARLARVATGIQPQATLIHSCMSRGNAVIFSIFQVFATPPDGMDRRPKTGSYCFASPKSIKLLFVFAALFCLPGCATNMTQAPPSQKLEGLPPARLTDARMGDRYYFANGRREKVIAVDDGLVLIRRSSRYRYSAFPDPLFPAARVERSSGISEKRVKGLEPAGSVWPLEMGNSVKFEVLTSKGGMSEGDVAQSGRYWNCSVDGMERVAIVSGEFDSYRIECIRKNRRNRIKQYTTRYFAVDIGQVVMRIDRYPDKPDRKLELLAFQPDMDMLGKRSQRRFRKYFQKVLDSVPSGTTKSWWSRASDTRIHLTPTKSLKFESGHYCRNYLVRISHKGLLRRGAGLVCRDKAGRWRIPKSIDNREDVVFRK